MTSMKRIWRRDLFLKISYNCEIIVILLCINKPLKYFTI